MREKLKEIILDFHAQELPRTTPREMKLESVPGKATICIGVRRCGKTTFLFQIMEQLQKKGVDRRNMLYMNFFDDRLHALSTTGLGEVTDVYFALYPEKKQEKVYCFFDEIQLFPGWESFVERILRTENCAVYISGSSSQLLSAEIATQMRGRALSWELFPFSFREYLLHTGRPVKSVLSSAERLHVMKAFDEYWEIGGFPEVASLSKELRIKTHQEYVNSILFRDLIERHDIAHPKAVVDLARRLIDNAASLYTVNALTGYLKALGHRIPKSAVSDYLAWFEESFFLFTTRVYDASLARSNTNPKKIYAVDHALVTSVASGILVNGGHLLENLVFAALRRERTEVFYYKTRSGREVDFAVAGEGGAPRLVQVCETVREPKTRKRELAALEEAMTELGIGEGMIVTRNEEETIAVEKGTIAVLPAWRFLLTGVAALP
ncbi:MAG TPA: ATP-binding protein [bacterium]|nr:ATP-binding protein [bacterium]